MNNKVWETVVAILAIVGSVALIVLLIFAIPIIGFGLGYLTGWILQVSIGGAVAEGLNIVFNTDRFTPEIIPLFCATMGMIGGFFKSKLVTKNKNED